MSGSKRLVLIDQAVVSGTGFLITVVLVRALGLGVFGTFALIELGALFALSLQQSRLGQPLLTFAPKQPDAQRPSYFAAALRLELWFTLVLAVLVAGTYGVYLDHWDAPATLGTWIPVTLTIVSRQLFAYLRAECFATGRVRRALCLDLLAYPTALVVLTVIWSRGELTLARTFWVLGGAASIACLAALPGVAGRGVKPQSLRETGAKHWGFARWLAGMSVAQFFASNSFLVAAAALLGAPAAGAIKAAQRVMGVLHLGFQAMENVVPVSAARLLAAEGMTRFRSYLTRILTLGFLATALISAGIAIFARFVLDLVYEGVVDDRMVLGLRAMAVLYVASFTITVLQIGFRTLETTRVVFAAYMANTFVAVVSAQPVVERFGYAGAVWGMAAQQGLMAALLLFEWRRAGLTSARSSSA